MSLESSLPTSVADTFVPSWNVTLNELDAVDDVGVGDDVAVGVVDPAGALGAARAALRVAELVGRPEDDDPDATMSTTPGVAFLYSCSRVVVVVLTAVGTVPTTAAVADGWLDPPSVAA